MRFVGSRDRSRRRKGSRRGRRGRRSRGQTRQWERYFGHVIRITFRSDRISLFRGAKRRLRALGALSRIRWHHSLLRRQHALFLGIRQRVAFGRDLRGARVYRSGSRARWCVHLLRGISSSWVRCCWRSLSDIRWRIIIGTGVVLRWGMRRHLRLFRRV